jgi:hypothetical protein
MEAAATAAAATAAASLEELKKKVAAAEQFTRQFLLLTREYHARVLRAPTPHLYLKHYLYNWFRSFLAFKDEVMLLIQGAVHRRYHEKEHQGFKHARDADSKTGCEARFYTNFRFLTGCSTDGIKYAAYHNKKAKVLTYGQDRCLNQLFRI